MQKKDLDRCLEGVVFEKDVDIIGGIDKKRHDVVLTREECDEFGIVPVNENRILGIVDHVDLLPTIFKKMGNRKYKHPFLEIWRVSYYDKGNDDFVKIYFDKEENADYYIENYLK